MNAPPAANPTDPTTPEKQPQSPPGEPGSRSVLALPFAFSLLLAAFVGLPQVRENSHLLWAFLGASAALLTWCGALFASATAKGRALSARFVLRRPHWLQPLVQLSIYIYWGWHWRQVYSSAYLIVAQIVFAYAFDMLLAWSQGDDFELGFGPFPIILSMNLFLWFKPDWFYWQFVMVALGFGVKRLVRWQKDGHRAHIFNPSSFPLAVFSLALLVTGTTDHTWGIDIAKTIGDPRHVYVFLFLISLPGQFLFGVASMTMPAVVAAFACSQLYFWITGTYFFFGTIPTAAFLGMLLLFTDPSTAPRSELGRVLYGAAYGVCVFLLYGLLDLFGLPLFYDKLLFVPFLNLSVIAIDRFAEHPRLERLGPKRLLPGLTGRRRNVAWMGVWTAGFIGLLLAHGVGDFHPANRLPFWQKACNEGLRNGCRNLETMEKTMCAKGAAWACNEYGIRLLQPGRTPDPGAADANFARACSLGFRPGCANQQLAALGASALRREPPDPEGYEQLIDNRGLPTQRTVRQELHWACDQGWTEACSTISSLEALEKQGTPDAPGSRKRAFEQACTAGDHGACRALGTMYSHGDGVEKDDQRALACMLGMPDGCVDASRATAP